MSSTSSHQNARRVARVGGKSLVAVVSFVLLLMTGWGYYNLSALTRHERTIDVRGLGPPVATPGAPAPTGSDAPPAAEFDGTAQNILIVGLDSRAGLTTAQEHHLKVGDVPDTMNTDTIMLVHVPADGSKATLMSIPRDSWVHIPGYRDNKINVAYADGYFWSGAKTVKDRESEGASTLVATVKQLTGVPIDHYVEVGFGGFEQIVKAIGSIPVNLCHSVDDTHAYNAAHGIQGGSGFKMSAGHHDLNPQQALEFVRQRHNIPGPVSDDFGRELRQRYFLDTAFNTILSANVLLNPVKLHHLVDAIDGAFTFDRHNFDILKFAEQMTHLTAGNIVGRSIPTEGNIVVGNEEALRVNPAHVQQVVRDAFYGAKHAGHHAGRHGKHNSAGLTSPAKQNCVN